MSDYETGFAALDPDTREQHVWYDDPDEYRAAGGDLRLLELDAERNGDWALVDLLKGWV